MLPSSLQANLELLDKSIADTQSVIQDLRRAVNETSNPIELRRYQSDIKRLKGYIAEYLQEYQNLCEMFSTFQQPSVEKQEISTQIQSLHTNLQQLQTTVSQVDQKVDQVLGGQAILHQSLSKMQQELLSYYDARERRIVHCLVETFNQNQVQLTQAMLSTLNNLSQSQMEQVLSLIEVKVLPSLPNTTKEAAAIVKDANLDVRHRLKVAIPLIPFIELESEVELGTGMDLMAALRETPKELWRQVVLSLRRRK